MQPTTRRPGLHLSASPIIQAQDTQLQNNNQDSPRGSPTTAMAATLEDTPALNPGETPLQSSENDQIESQQYNDQENHPRSPSVATVGAPDNSTIPNLDNPIPQPSIGNQSKPTQKQICNAAIKMINDGLPLSTIGTVLPSRHRGFLRALYIGPMTAIRQFFTSEDGIADNDESNGGLTINSNKNVIYLDKWNINTVIEEAKTFIQNEPDTEDPEHSTIDQECQKIADKVPYWHRSVRTQLKVLEKTVHRYHAKRILREQKEQDALELVVNDPKSKIPGHLQYAHEYWQDRLGWTNFIYKFWYDTPEVDIAERKFRYVAFGPAPKFDLRTHVHGTRIPLVKYYFSEDTGTWKTEEGLEEERQQEQIDLNNFLIGRIGNIEQDRDKRLVEENLVYITQILDRNDVQLIKSLGSWTGGLGQPGQKCTTERKLKKQVPQRSCGSGIPFVPEDGGMTGLEQLIEAAQNIEADALAVDEDATGGIVATIEPTTKRLTPIPEEEENGTKKGKGKRRGKATKKKPAAKKTKKATPTASSRVTTRSGSVAIQQNKRKRTEEPDDTAVPTAASSGDVQPAKKPKIGSARAKSATPAPAPIRQSSRIANKKRKAEEDPEVEADTGKTPAKKPKTGTNTTEETREATAPAATEQAEDVQENVNDAATAQQQSGSKEATPQAEAEAETEEGDGAQATPIRPTTTTILANITTSPLPPLTATVRASLMANFPFLEDLSDEVDFNIGTSRRGEWLQFLSYFGRGQAVAGQLNRFFEVEGAVTREEEMLEAVRARIAELKRVEDREDGSRAYVWSN